MKLLQFLCRFVFSSTILTAIFVSGSPICAFDFRVDQATLSSGVNNVRDTAVFGDLRSTAIAVGSSEARATYTAQFTANTFRFGISSQRLIFRGGQIAIWNEGALTFTLNEPAYYSFSGTNIWTGTTLENVGPQVSLSRIHTNGTSDTIYFERDSINASAGGFGIDGIAQGDINFRHGVGTNSGYLFPGTYRVEYMFSVSDYRQDFIDNLEVNGWFSFDLQSERGSVADPLARAIGLQSVSSGGNKPWTATLLTGKDNGDSGRSGEIANSQSSWIKTDVGGAAVLSFWWKVSSQTNMDFLEIALDSRPLRRISGLVDWQQVVLYLPVPAMGFHEITWTYSKGLNGRSGEDAAWIDGVTIMYLEPDASPPRLPQTIQFAQPPLPLPVTAPVELVASASSGLPVLFEVLSGPALVRGNILVPTGVGTVVTRASQPGDAVFLPAPPIDRTLNVSAEPPRPLALDTPQLSVLVGDPDARTIEAIAVQPDGKIIVGGYFAYASGQRRANIARFNQDGTLDPLWAPQIDGRGVSSLVIRNDSLYVAGHFWNVNGIPRQSLAKVSLGETGVVDPLWNPAANDHVWSIAATEDALIIGGSFASVGGTPHKYLAKVSLSGRGELDPLWKPNPNNTVFQVSSFGTSLYFFGSFDTVGSLARRNLAKASTLASGSVDPNWNTTFASNLWVKTILPTETGLYVGGDSQYTTYGPSLAFLSAGDGRVLRLGYDNTIITALSLHHDALYVARGFDLTRPLSSHSLDKVSPTDFAKDPAWNVPIVSKLFPGAGYPGKISAIAINSGNIILGGDFRSVSGSPGPGLAILPGFSGPPLVTNGVTSTNRLTSSVAVAPNPDDLIETKSFRIGQIQHGTLYGFGFRQIQDGDFISLDEGRLGLKFMPEDGFSGVASFNVRATSGDTALDISSPPADVLITVLEKRYSQSVVIKFQADVPLNVGSIKLEATASSGLPVQFTVSGPAYLESPDVLRLTGVGEVTVFAKQSGNEAYEPALPVGTFFRVLRGVQTIAFLSPTNAHVNIPMELNAVATSGLPVRFELLSGSATLFGKRLTFLEPGTVVVRVIQDGNAQIAPAQFDQEIAVGKAAQTITFSPIPSLPFDAGPILLNAVSSSGLAVSFRIVSGNATVSGFSLRPLGAGEVTVEAFQPGNAEFEAASIRQTAFFVRATPTIWYESIPGEVFIGQQFQIRAGSSAGLPVIVSIASGVAQLVGDTLTITALGPLQLRYSLPGNADYVGGEATSDIIRAYPGKQTITWAALQDASFDKRSIPLIASASSGLPVSFRVLLGPAQVSGTNLVFLGTGVVQVQAYQPGTVLYDRVDGPVHAFTISKGIQTISFQPLPNVVAGGRYPLNATASSGLAVTFAVSSGPATITAFNEMVVTNAGTIVILARQNGDTNYYAAETNQTITASKASQTINFPPMSDQAWNSGPIVLNATSSSGLTISFTLVSGPATLLGNLLQPVGAGEVVVRATQPGNEAFDSAEIIQRFNLKKATQSLEFAPLRDIRFSDPAPELRAATTSPLTPRFSVISGPVVLSNNLAIPIGIGTAVIEASLPGNDLFEPALAVQRAFAILKGLQQITFPAPTTLRMGSSAELQATASSGLPVEFGVLSGPGILSGRSLTPVGLGEIRIIAMQPGGATYEPATPVEQLLVVSKGLQTIQFELPATALVNDGPLSLRATASSGLPVRYLVLSGPATLNGNSLTPVSPGLVQVRAFQSGDDSFDPAPNADRTVTFVSARPSLQIQRDPTAAFLNWPSTFSDYAVEASSSLDSASWKPLDETIETVEGSIRIRISPSAGNIFYRLKQRSKISGSPGLAP